MPSTLVDQFSYVLSRIDFVLAHAVFAIWIAYVSNDPLNFKRFAPGLINTLDVDAESVKDCSVDSDSSSIDYNAARYDVLVFLLVWWLPHSGLARNTVKRAIGLGPTHPLDRPIFSFIAPLTWLATIVLWKPITSCSRLDVMSVTLKDYFWRLPVVLFFLVEVLGLFYLLPDHVFGTDRYKWSTKMPEHKLIVAFPYALVRHPAAAFFLFAYWIGIPSYNANHLLLATEWTVFLVVGTLVFEEGGLREHEFQDQYKNMKMRKCQCAEIVQKTRRHVVAFIWFGTIFFLSVVVGQHQTIWALLRFLILCMNQFACGGLPC